MNLFVGFLVTKHGLAPVMQADRAEFSGLHAYFLDRLVPVCAALLGAAQASGEAPTDIAALALMRGAGNLYTGTGQDPRYDARALVQLLVAGLRQPEDPQP